MQEREYFKKSLKEVEKIEQELSPMENEIIKNLEEIEEIASLNCETVVNFYNEIRDKIKEREQNLIKKVVELKHEETRKFNQNMEKIKNVLENISNLKNVKNSINDHSDLDFLNNSKNYFSQLKDVLNIPHQIPSNNISLIEINREEEISLLKDDLTNIIGEDLEIIEKVVPEKRSSVPIPKNHINFPSFSNTYNIRKNSTSGIPDKKNSQNNISQNLNNKLKGKASVRISKKTSSTDINLISIDNRNFNNSDKEKKDPKDAKTKDIKSSINKVTIQDNQTTQKVKITSKNSNKNTNNPFKSDLQLETYRNSFTDQDTFTFVTKKNETFNENIISKTKEKLNMFPSFKSNTI